MADANSVSPGLATLGAGGWTVTEPSAGGRFGSVGVLTPQQTLAIQALVSSGAGISTQFAPYAIATWGDSRNNTGSASPDVGGSQLLSDVRASTWAVAELGDCEITRNYGVSGDAAVNWNSAARTGGKTFLDLDASALDVVLVEYGINDAMAGTSAATITAALQALCTQILKSGKRLVFESIQPIRAPASNPATAQATADAVNAAMQAWIATLPRTQAGYADTASVLKSADGYANPTYYDAGRIHLIAAGARAARKVLAKAIRALLPAKSGLFPVVDQTAPNMLNLLVPDAFAAFEVGTGAATISYGQDSRGYFVQWDVTPATFSSGECRARLGLSANFQTASPPYYALSGNEVLQGSAQIVLDNGVGGAPNAYALGLRQRFFTGAIFRDWGILPAGSPGATLTDFDEAVDLRLITPRVTNATASTVANPADSAGYQLQIFVSSQNTTPYRVRSYNPRLGRVGWSTALLSVTPPASGSPYTNTTTARQQVFVSGGTVSGLAVNGIATGLTSGIFVLQPGDTLTPTHSGAPVMWAKQLP